LDATFPAFPGRAERHFATLSHAGSMLCYYCENQARATCRFCGAGVCKSHVAAARFASGGASPDPMSGMQRSEFVLVNNAIWCGRCQAQWFVAPQ
jgi:hypothetical protein